MTKEKRERRNMEQYVDTDLNRKDRNGDKGERKRDIKED